MSATQVHPPKQRRPLVVVLCAVPFVGEAVESILEFADVRSFSGPRVDTAGLLRWLKPAAVVVDNSDDLSEAASFADDSDATVVFIAMHERELRIFHRGGWQQFASAEGPTAEAVRNVLAGILFARAEEVP